MKVKMLTLIIIISVVLLILVIVLRQPSCPPEIQHLPEIPRLGLLKSLIQGEPFDENYKLRIAPFLNEMGSARMLAQGKWTVIVSQKEHLHQIYNNPTNFRKSAPDFATSPRLLFKFLGLKNIFLNDLEQWKQIRTTVNPAFKKSWDPVLFSNITKEFIEKVELSRLQGKSSDIHKLFQKLTIDALSRGLLSYDFQAQRGGNDPNLKLYTDIMNGIFDPFCLITPSLENILPSRSKLRKKNHQFRQFLSLLIKKRKQEIKLNSNYKNDILTLMIQQSMSHEEIVNNLATFFSTGHDTTANALTSLITYLALFPNIQNKLREEVLDQLGDDNELNPPNHTQQRAMAYLGQVLKESLRMLPTIGVVRRYCSESTLLSNLLIPKGVNIILHLWGLHHNPDYFPNPHEFNPERFKDPRGPQSRIWAAFGGGSRLCIGVGFSYVEQRVVLALLIKKYTFHLASPTPTLCPYGLLHFNNVRIRFEPRF